LGQSNQADNPAHPHSANAVKLIQPARLLLDGSGVVGVPEFELWMWLVVVIGLMTADLGSGPAWAVVVWRGQV